VGGEDEDAWGTGVESSWKRVQCAEEIEERVRQEGAVVCRVAMLLKLGESNR